MTLMTLLLLLLIGILYLVLGGNLPWIRIVMKQSFLLSTLIGDLVALDLQLLQSLDLQLHLLLLLRMIHLFQRECLAMVQMVETILVLL